MLKIQNILIQVNISKESSKSGADAENVLDLIDTVRHLENLSVKGL